jgi:hypothetical protein
MLEGDYSETLNTLLQHLPTNVWLPAGWEEAPRSAGKPSLPGDRRRYARVPLQTEAVCEILPTLPAIERPHGLMKVYTKDISRGGVAFLTPLQLYPKERILLWMSNGKLACEVMRCSKLGEKCYEIGAAFPGK